MAAGTEPASVAWNKLLFEKVVRDIVELKGQGKEILLMGDFNGHIGKAGIGGNRADKRGKLLKEAWDKWGLILVNRSEKCQGRWTRMRGESKSEIDFVLIEEGCVERVNRMTIYEEGELGLHQSDHNWVEVNINHTGG